MNNKREKVGVLYYVRVNDRSKLPTPEQLQDIRKLLTNHRTTRNTAVESIMKSKSKH